MTAFYTLTHQSLDLDVIGVSLKLEETVEGSRAEVVLNARLTTSFYLSDGYDLRKSPWYVRVLDRASAEGDPGFKDSVAVVLAPRHLDQGEKTGEDDIFEVVVLLRDTNHAALRAAVQGGRIPRRLSISVGNVEPSKHSFGGSMWNLEASKHLPIDSVSLWIPSLRDISGLGEIELQAEAFARPASAGDLGKVRESIAEASIAVRRSISGAVIVILVVIAIIAWASHR